MSERPRNPDNFPARFLFLIFHHVKFVPLITWRVFHFQLFTSILPDFSKMDGGLTYAFQGTVDKKNPFTRIF